MGGFIKVRGRGLGLGQRGSAGARARAVDRVWCVVCELQRCNHHKKEGGV